jgi:hypothetical protein
MKLAPGSAAGIGAPLALGAALALAANAAPGAAHTYPVPLRTRPAALGPGLGRPPSAVSAQMAQVCAKAAAKAGYSRNEGGTSRGFTSR